MHGKRHRFETDFTEWIAKAVENGVPDAVRAFAFNLFELAQADEARFAVELVGTSEFSGTESDWACTENWEPIQRTLRIPISFSGEAWGECIWRVQSLIQNMLESDSNPSRILKSRDGIGIGFVDGDLRIVRP